MLKRQFGCMAMVQHNVRHPFVINVSRNGDRRDEPEKGQGGAETPGEDRQSGWIFQGETSRLGDFVHHDAHQQRSGSALYLDHDDACALCVVDAGQPEIQTQVNDRDYLAAQIDHALEELRRLGNARDLLGHPGDQPTSPSRRCGNCCAN
jgi:hypothetical protein